MDESVIQIIIGIAAAVAIAGAAGVLAWRSASKRKYDPDEPVTLANFTTANDAEVWAMRLRSQGIECFVVGGDYGRAMPIAGLRASGAHLQVRAADMARAMAVIARS